MRAPPPRGGSTIHAAYAHCEVFSCHAKHGVPLAPGWSCWRIMRSGRVSSTWLMCDRHKAHSEEIDRDHVREDESDGMRMLYLPLIRPALQRDGTPDPASESNLEVECLLTRLLDLLHAAATYGAQPQAGCV